MQAIRSILVLGGGSAGFLAAITLKTRIPSLQVTVLKSPDIGIIGVGEGTTVAVPQHLHGYLGIDLREFHARAEPLWKLGIRFYWGSRPFFDFPFSHQLDTQYSSLSRSTGYYCTDPDWSYVGLQTGLMSHNAAFHRQSNGFPALSREVTNDLAYHIENEKFVGWCDGHARGLGVEIIDGTVADVRRDETGIAALVLESRRELSAHLYVDSSGFYSRLLGKEMAEPFLSFKSTLLCDRAVVGGWAREDEQIKPYTVAETMDAGWCWQIDHENRINRGYVYSSSFISDDAAEREFRVKNPKVPATRIVKFVSGRYERAWVENVVGIGNSAGFVEPLEATSLSAICTQCKVLAESLIDSNLLPGPAYRHQFNVRNALSWDMIRQFLGVHYRFNTRLETPFWRECREKVDIYAASEIVEFYREAGPSVLFRTNLLEAVDPFGMEGYLSMLVGQQVPYRNVPPVAEREWSTWANIRRVIAEKSRAGVTVAEVLQLIRDPRWQWPVGLYGDVGVARPTLQIETGIT